MPKGVCFFPAKLIWALLSLLLRELMTHRMWEYSVWGWRISSSPCHTPVVEKLCHLPTPPTPQKKRGCVDLAHDTLVMVIIANLPALESRLHFSLWERVSYPVWLLQVHGSWVGQDDLYMFFPAVAHILCDVWNSPAKWSGSPSLC